MLQKSTRTLQVAITAGQHASAGRALRIMLLSPRLRMARRLPLEQNTLAFDAPGIARERTIVPNDAVAGDGDGEAVRGACVGDRARGLGGSDASSDFGVGSRLASRDLLKRTPYALLEGGAANIERKIKAEPRR